MEHLAPPGPVAAANTYAAKMSDYSGKVAALVEREFIRHLPMPPELQASKLMQLQVALDRLAAKYTPAARAAARQTATQQRRWVEDAFGVSFLRTPGRVEGERAFLVAFGNRAQGRLVAIGAAQVAALQKQLALGVDAEALRRTLWVSRNMPQVMAHDEVWGVSHDVLGYWSQEAGSKGYRWVTRRDERVRARHAAVDGKRFDWSDPPAVGRNGEHHHPGGDYNCRCRALPEEVYQGST